MENAQYLKNVVLGGIGRRPWSELRRKMSDCQANLPSYEMMLQYEKEISYDVSEYQGGSKASLQKIIQVRMQRRLGRWAHLVVEIDEIFVWPLHSWLKWNENDAFDP